MTEERVTTRKIGEGMSQVYLFLRPGKWLKSGKIWREEGWWFSERTDDRYRLKRAAALATARTALAGSEQGGEPAGAPVGAPSEEPEAAPSDAPFKVGDRLRCFRGPCDGYRGPVTSVHKSGRRWRVCVSVQQGKSQACGWSKDFRVEE